MKEILLVGGGGHCKSIIDILQQEGRYNVAGIIERRGSDLDKDVLGFKILGSDVELEDLSKKYKYALVSVGQIRNSAAREELYFKLKELGFSIPTIFSPSSYVSPFSTVDSGSTVHHNAVVNAGTIVGENCIINSHSLIEHDCHISTGAILNGGVTVGQGSFIGSGAVIVEGVSIAPRSFIKAGSLVK